ncbi:FtsX-like permease family protein [Dactylosporangium sp. CA-139066]|uniref:FtsX-like permease family protein n=1 Tax=Dactylosporangium sp. CA-139066 TaxID=3239930 RepID=UPI003D915CFB
MALLLGVLTATTGFTVLTGATGTARLVVNGEVDRTAVAAYQVLVRPKGVRTQLENDRQKVRPNSLSGIYGGISRAQLATIAGLDGVDVAAPIAMAGYANTSAASGVDITGLVDKSLDRQVIRVDRHFSADRGLSAVDGRPFFVYITKHPVSFPIIDGYGPKRATFTGGEVIPGETLCSGEISVLEDGQPVCNWITGGILSDLLTDDDNVNLEILHLTADGRFQQGGLPPGNAVETFDQLRVGLSWARPMLLAAVDPVAEAKLVGLDRAVTTGRYLSASDRVTKSYDEPILPVIAVDQPYPDNGLSIAVSRIAVNAPPPGTAAHDAIDALDALHGPVLDTRTVVPDPSTVGHGAYLNPFMLTGDVTYRENPDGSLSAVTVPENSEAWRTPDIHGIFLPWQIDDTSFRTVSQAHRLGGTQIVGTYDPGKVAAFNPLSRVPMETYAPPEATGGDQRTRDLLGGQPLRPDGNPAGYLSTPPTLLTTLDAFDQALAQAGQTTARQAPISAIRVRVAGVSGFTAESRERVRVVAERIAAETGLDVDITYGSSPVPQLVDVAAGAKGRPALRLSELWTRKGVAAAIVSAVDRKSVVLFLLVLVVCALFLANAVAAGVRDRRTELATLTALGWPARRVFAIVLGEVAAIGLVAGAGTMLLAGPLGLLLDVRVPWGRALLAVPIALALSLLAGLPPALAASRARPAKGLRPVALRPRRAGRPRGPVGMGLRNLLRVPGRTLLGAAALAIGITAATVLGAITFAFHGAIIGTLLGDAVSLQVRSVDTIAVVATVLLGALAVADVLYLNIRDRAAELATLRATGWTAGALGRLVAAEGFGIGVLGGLLGAGLGLAGAAWLVGAVTDALIWTAAGALAAGSLVATAAALVPALLLQRMPTAHLLAEE